MELKRNLLYSIGGQISVFILAFSFYTLLSRWLGPADFGLYTIVMLVPLLAGRFGHLGVDAANAYFIDSGKYQASDIFGNSLVLTVIVFLLASCGVFVFYLLDSGSHLRSHSALLAAIAPIAGLSAYRTLFQSTLVGQDRLRAFSFIAIVDSLFPLFGIVCLFGFNFLSVTSAVIVNFLSLVITCLVLYRISRFSGSLQFNYQLAKKSVNYGWKSWVNNLANQALYKVDVFIIGIMLDLSSVGIYTVGVLIIEKCWYLSGAIGNAIYPKLKNMDIYKGRNLAALAAKSNLYITSFGAIAISIFSVWIIKTLFGDDYYGSALVIVLLAPGIIFLAVPKILVSHLAAKDKLELAVQASLTALIVNLVANVLFIPFAGIYGAAIASSLAYLVYLAIYLWNYIKTNGNVATEKGIISSNHIFRVRNTCFFIKLYTVNDITTVRR